jgi:hypothetical protein
LAASHQTDLQYEREVRFIRFIHHYTMTDTSSRHTMYIGSFSQSVPLTQYPTAFSLQRHIQYHKRVTTNPQQNNDTHPSPNQNINNHVHSLDHRVPMRPQNHLDPKTRSGRQRSIVVSWISGQNEAVIVTL